MIATSKFLVGDIVAMGVKLQIACNGGYFNQRREGKRVLVNDVKVCSSFAPIDLFFRSRSRRQPEPMNLPTSQAKLANFNNVGDKITSNVFEQYCMARIAHPDVMLCLRTVYKREPRAASTSLKASFDARNQILARLGAIVLLKFRFSSVSSPPGSRPSSFRSARNFLPYWYPTW